MRNKIEKAHKTRFDYIAARLGILGFVLLVTSAIVGGTVLTSLGKENRVLTQALTETVSTGGRSLNNRAEGDVGFDKENQEDFRYIDEN